MWISIVISKIDYRWSDVIINYIILLIIQRNISSLIKSSLGQNKIMGRHLKWGTVCRIFKITKDYLLSKF